MSDASLTPAVDALTLVLPLPPSINEQYATVNGRRVLARTGREFKALVATEVERWCAAHPSVEPTLWQQHYLTLQMTCYFRSALRRDLDGGLKITQDALCQALGINDNRVVEIHLYKRVDRQTPRLELHLTALPVASVMLETADTAHVDLQLPELPARRPRRQRRPRSLEELATEHKWT